MPFFAVIAQAAVAASPVAAVPAQGVTTYPAAFFAEYRPNTALDMVNRLPGFSLDTGDSVRGFEGAAGNVLIDGARPASKTDDLDDILSRLPAGQVERIDVIRGGAPGVDMQGKTILANVVRRKGTGRRQGVVQLSTRSFYDGRVILGGRVEGSGQAAGGSWEAGVRLGGGTDDGYGPTKYVQTAPDGRVLAASDIKAHAETRNVVATAAFERPLAGGKIRLNARGYYEHFRFNEANVFTFPAPDAIANEDGQERNQTELGARYDRDLGPRTKLEVIALRQTDYWDYHSNATLPRNDYNYFQTSDTAETIGRSVLKFRQSDALSWELGGEFALNTLEGDSGYKERGVVVALPAPQVEVEEKRGEIFAKSVWRPRPGWTIEAGLREEGSRITATASDDLNPGQPAVRHEKTLYYTKPRLAVTWDATGATQLRARLERVVGQLNFDDFVSSASLNEGVVRAGNVDLVPEQAWVSEAAVEQRFWKSGSIILAVRHYAIRDTVDRAPIFDPAGVYDAPANIGDGTKDEAELSLTIPLDRLQLRGAEFRGSLTAKRSEVLDPTTHRPREISSLHPLDWDAHYVQPLPRWNANWGFDVFGGWRRTNYRYNEITDDKLRTFVAMFYEWKPGGGWTVRGEVQNLTARGFRHTRNLYGGPRDTAGLARVEDRDVDVGRTFLISVRKNFGG